MRFGVLIDCTYCCICSDISQPLSVAVAVVVVVVVVELFFVRGSVGGKRRQTGATPFVTLENLCLLYLKFGSGRRETERFNPIPDHRSDRPPRVRIGAVNDDGWDEMGWAVRGAVNDDGWIGRYGGEARLMRAIVYVFCTYIVCLFGREMTCAREEAIKENAPQE